MHTQGPPHRDRVRGPLRVQLPPAMLYGMGMVRTVNRTGKATANGLMILGVGAAIATVLYAGVFLFLGILALAALAGLTYAVCWVLYLAIHGETYQQTQHRAAHEQAAARLEHERRHMPTNPARHSNRR